MTKAINVSGKLIARRVDSLPEEFYATIRDKTQPTRHIQSCIAISLDNRYVTDQEGKPLLFIWAHRNSLLSRKVELAMIATEHFNIRHAREGKRLIWDWIAEQSVSVFARCNRPDTRRFLDFLEFTKVEELEGTINYKAVY